MLPLSEGGRPDTDLIQIRNITGLEPVKANVNTSPLGSVDGESFSGSSVPKRNIVVTLGLNPDWDEWTMSQLRRLLYAYFMPKLSIRLVLESDDLDTVEIYGYVESCEPVLFSKDGEVQVSIICPDPYFTSVDPIVVTGVSSDGSDPAIIQYNGSIETGINVEITEAAVPAPAVISIQVGDPSLSNFRIDATVSATKYLVMNSISGKKYVRQIETGTGVITNLLGYVESGYTWPILQPGENEFSVISNAGTQDWQLTYFERFGGL
jgi:hypothetical protein